MLGTVSLSSGLFWSWREATVDSSCWEFWVECALEYPSWRKSRGLLSALTSRTAPGNASHSSSWQLLGHFQKAGEKTHWDYFLEHLGPESGGSQRTEIENTWQLESISGFSTSPSLLVSFPEITRWKRGPPPPNTPIYSFKELFFI